MQQNVNGQFFLFFFLLSTIYIGYLYTHGSSLYSIKNSLWIYSALINFSSRELAKVLQKKTYLVLSLVSMYS